MKNLLTVFRTNYPARLNCPKNKGFFVQIRDAVKRNCAARVATSVIELRFGCTHVVSFLPHLNYRLLGVRMLTRTFQSNGQRVLRQLPTACHACGLRRYTTESPAAVGLSDPSAYCKELVRKHDYESFLVSHFYPKPKQDAYFAIKAFSVSILRDPYRFWSVTFNSLSRLG